MKILRQDRRHAQVSYDVVMSMQGNYAKGVAKREEILTSALEVFSSRGYRDTSLREIADQVGLTPAGVLHYFGSKDELFVQVLRKRAEVDWLHHGGEDAVEALARLAQHNSTVPGLVELFMSMAISSTNPEHVAHGFFADHYSIVNQALSTAMRAEQKQGALSQSLNPEQIAEMFISLADGLQLQWLHNPQIDMSEQIRTLWTVLLQVP